jgi:gas vesicle protein
MKLEVTGEMEKDDAGSAVVWFLAGAATGAALALLYAPKTGKDTRKLLHKTTREGRDAVESSGKELMDRGRELYDRGKKIADDAAELFERGRKLVQH